MILIRLGTVHRVQSNYFPRGRTKLWRVRCGSLNREQTVTPPAPTNYGWILGLVNGTWKENTSSRQRRKWAYTHTYNLWLHQRLTLTLRHTGRQDKIHSPKGTTGSGCSFFVCHRFFFGKQIWCRFCFDDFAPRHPLERDDRCFFVGSCWDFGEILAPRFRSWTLTHTHAYEKWRFCFNLIHTYTALSLPYRLPPSPARHHTADVVNYGSSSFEFINNHFLLSPWAAATTIRVVPHCTVGN